MKQFQLAFRVDDLDEPRLQVIASILRNVADNVETGISRGNITVVGKRGDQDIGTYAIVDLSNK